MDPEIDREVDIFDKLGRFEYPVRGLVEMHEGGEYVRRIYDVQTGELLSSIPPTANYNRIVFVLDGDHGITQDHKVYSFSKMKVVQEIQDMAEFFKQTAQSRYFTSLSIPEKYAYSACFSITIPEVYAVFDPDLTEKKFVTHRHIDPDRIAVWGWNGKEVKKEYEFDFKAPVHQVISLQKVARLSSESEVAIALYGRSFVIFDVIGRKILRQVDVSHLYEQSLFLLPNGHLCLKNHDLSRGNLSLMDLTVKLKSEEKVELREGPEDKLVSVGDYSYFVILNDPKFPDHFFIVFFYQEQPYEVLRTAVSPIHPEVIRVNGRVPRNPRLKVRTKDLQLCMFSLHGSDIAFLDVRKSVKVHKLVIYDLSTGEVRQNLELGKKEEEVDTDPCLTLPGNRYLLSVSHNQVRMLEYDQRTGKYSFGKTVYTQTLLPVTTLQKRIMGCYLDDLFVEERIPVPKELVGVIAKFI